MDPRRTQENTVVLVLDQQLIVNIIVNRLRPWYETQLLDEQNGFRKNRGTTDGIYPIKRVQQITNRKKHPLYLLFVDLSAAFDNIPRAWLFNSIKLRFPIDTFHNLIDILATLYSNTSLTYEEANATFETILGGGPESPMLFTLYINFVMRVFIEKSNNVEDIDFFVHVYRIHTKAFTREERADMRNKNVRPWGSSTLAWCGYADDLVLFLQSLKGLQEATNLIDETFKRFGLSINKNKTETMIINASNDEQPTSIISLQGTKLKNLEGFKYVSAHLQQQEPNTGDTELNYRIQMANAKFAELSNLLQNFRVNLRIRILFLNSFVRSTLTYACQNWNLTSYQYERLYISCNTFCSRFFFHAHVFSFVILLIFYYHIGLKDFVNKQFC